MRQLQHILLEPYCIFCRSTAFLNHSHAESYEEEVFCFFEIAPNEQQGHRRPRGFRMSSKKEFTPILGLKLNKELLDAGKMLCFIAHDGACSLNHTANVAHIPCLQLAMGKFRWITTSSLCQLSKVLQPIIAWGNAANVFTTKPSVSALPFLETNSGELGLLLHGLRKNLPTEILGMVCAEIPDGLFASLARCYQTIRWLESSTLDIRRMPSMAVTCVRPLSQHEEPTMIRAASINILGEDCLCRVGVDPSTRFHHEISLSDKRVSGIQFALGTYAVQGLRICYEDGSVSAWLGKAVSAWKKFVAGSDLRNMQIKTDGLKILAAGFAQDSEAEPQNDTIWPIWNKDVTFSEDARCSMINLRADFTISIRGNPRTHFASYLDLSFKDGQEHSLTAFCSAKGVSCLQVDGDHQRRLGRPSPHSCPITFYLSRNETIHSIHLVARQSSNQLFAQGPFLTVQTSAGRTLYYGVLLIPSVTLAQGFFARFDESGTHVVSGIFSDPTTYLETHKTIGVVLETPDARGKAYSGPSLLTIPSLSQYKPRVFLGEYLHQTFLSTASFSGAKSLKMQKRDGRCVGLLAILDNAEAAVLGQWDPSEAETISTIYEGIGGPLLRITFIFSDGPQHERYVQEVVVNGNSIVESNFNWNCLEQSLAWLFTTHHDSIGYWEVFNLEVPATASALPLVKVAV